MYKKLKLEQRPSSLSLLPHLVDCEQIVRGVMVPIKTNRQNGSRALRNDGVRGTQAKAAHRTDQENARGKV